MNANYERPTLSDMCYLKKVLSQYMWGMIVMRLYAAMLLTSQLVFDPLKGRASMFDVLTGCPVLTALVSLSCRLAVLLVFVLLPAAPGPSGGPGGLPLGLAPGRRARLFHGSMLRH